MKKCTGCGRTDEKPLGLNKNGEPYLACCPDNNYKEMTAVEWFISNIPDLGKFIPLGISLEIHAKYQIAKEMEKQQHGHTWDESLDNLKARGMNEMRAYCDFDEYYNTTYGK